MKRIFVALVVLGAIAVGATARAVNSPVFRDCSLIVSGVDADFVHLSAVGVSPDGSLTVRRSQNFVDLTSKESFDLMDNSGHVTLKATITTTGLPTLTFTGAGTEFAILQLTLLGSNDVGRVYTISWSATFDNGGHACPSSLTPQNTGPHPFTVKVVE